MENININISIDSELKDRAQSIFEALGLDISTAINMLLRRAIYQEEMALEMKNKYRSADAGENDDSVYLIKPDTTRTPVFGCMRESIEIPPDFDEPLDEMKEYMF